MKKIVTLSFIILLAFNANAQFIKGNKVLGLGLNFQTSKEETETTTPYYQIENSLHFSTELGFATRENRLNGFFLGAGFSNTKYEVPSQPASNRSSQSYHVSGGYFTRAYRTLGKNFFVFGEGRASLNYWQHKNSIFNNSQSKQYGVNVGVYPGLAYRWNQRFLFEIRFADFVNVGYTYRKLDNGNNQKSTQNSFGIGSSLGLGYLNNIGIGARWIIKS